MKRLSELIPVLMAHGVSGDRLEAAALEVQRQTVIYASVWATGDYGAHYGEKARARGMIRKMFPGTVLRDSWDPVNAEQVAAYDNGNRGVFATTHQGGNGLGARWWWDSRAYPGEEAAAVWAANRERYRTEGVDAEGKRRDDRGNWYLVDMALFRAANPTYRDLSNVYILVNTSAYVEGLGVPGAPLPEWWDDECQEWIDGELRRDRDRNPHRRTAEQNAAYHR